MTNPIEPKGRVFALEIVAVQMLVTIVLSLAGLLTSSQITIAILSGGIICALANCWLAVVAFRPALGSSPSRMLAAFYMGEIGKFFISAVLFVIAFKKIALLKQPGNAFVMFAAYAFVQCTVWFYPLARSKICSSLLMKQ